MDDEGQCREPPQWDDTAHLLLVPIEHVVIHVAGYRNPWRSSTLEDAGELSAPIAQKR
jgi:hypothetical protein